MRHNSQMLKKLTKLPPISGRYAKTVSEVAVDLSGRGIAPLAKELAGAAAGGAGLLGGGAAAGAASRAKVILEIAVGVALVTALVTLIALSVKERPNNNTGEFQIVGVCWDHRGDPARGGLHYHKGGPDLPASMTDVPDSKGALNTLCVLVPRRLAAPTVDVTLAYTCADPAAVKRGSLRAYDVTSGKKVLGDQTVPYELRANTRLTVPLPFDAVRLPGDGLYRWEHTWEFWDGDTFITKCSCILYLLPDVPVAPWDIRSGAAYAPGEPAYPRVELLDFLLKKATEHTDIPKLCTQALNSGGFVYDVEGGGGCHYCGFLSHIFYLELFLAAAGKKDGREKTLNCADCAHIVSAACALAGKRLPIVKFASPRGNQGFDCNRIIAIGLKQWRYPFDTTGNAPKGGFSYHMFNAGQERLAADTPIYDACLRVDGGSYPGDGKRLKLKKDTLPAGMPAKDGEDEQVNVPPDRPYTKNCYRERLVLTGQYCDFDMSCIAYVASLGAPPAPRDVSPDPFIAAVMESFALAPTPEQLAAFAVRRSGDWTPEALPGAALDWSGPDHDRWKLEAGGQIVQVQHRRCDTPQQAAVRMAAQVASYTHPDKRPGEELGVEVGERRVVIGDRQIVFCRLGHVFAVSAGTLTAALAAAKLLDESVQAG